MRGSFVRILLIAMTVAILAGAVYAFTVRSSVDRTARVMSWLQNPAAHPEWAVHHGERCPGAPFALPSDGFIGFIWGDSFRIGHYHQGLDIFGGSGTGMTPVVAAYPGYLTRLATWRSAVIVRIPEDPLHPGQQIWTYYTHMADAIGRSLISPQFSPGVREIFIPAGTFLGYQGNYSGDPGNPVGVHLHFSIVKDDGHGWFLNELKIENTLDPSPYFGIALNARQSPAEIPVCDQEK
jgi:murein DD-endopeptidase MepM/ murein hydrolase activator NlpD